MSFELDQKIIRRLERGDDPEGIAKVFNVSVDYVQRLFYYCDSVVYKDEPAKKPTKKKSAKQK